MPRSETSSGAIAARAKMAEATAQSTEEKPIVIDPNDPKTLAANNGGGPIVPSSTEHESASVLNGTNVDLDAPITRAQRLASKAKKGKPVGYLLTPKQIEQIRLEIAAITDVQDKEGNIIRYATEEDEISFALQCKNGDFKNFKAQIETEAILQAPFKIKPVVFEKHATSPNTHTTTAADADKPLTYMFTVQRVEYTIPEIIEEEEETTEEEEEDFDAAEE